MSDEKNDINCPSCGIAFGFNKNVERIWRESHKSFFCPNGHAQSWAEASPSEKEHQARKEKVTELEKKLAVAETELEAAKKKIEELTIELEIWKPSVP